MKPLLFSFTLLFQLASFAQQSLYDTNVNAGLIVPKGFVAIKAATGMGRPRHIATASDGSLYVKTNKMPHAIYRLIDRDGDGKMDSVFGFANYRGTGIAIEGGYLYASSDEDVYRYKLGKDDQPIDAQNPEKIIVGLLNRREHETKSIALDNSGNIYVNIGAYSNSCQEQDRGKESKGMMPCPILDSAGGIWKFKCDVPGQRYGDGERFATGLRNVVGLDWNRQTKSLFVMQHGRDQLAGNWPKLYNEKENAELPSECMYELKKGADAGWPYIYYDHLRHKKILAPEYGGDGKKEGGADAIDPIVAFPGHLAPNGLLFYTGKQFPERYRNGAFIAFHGSWNRAPLPQKGYFVAFVPFKNGKCSGEWEIFADGFSGKTTISSTREALHRPCGLALAKDGSLFVSDDAGGVIYKISYRP